MYPTWEEARRAGQDFKRRLHYLYTGKGKLYAKPGTKAVAQDALKLVPCIPNDPARPAPPSGRWKDVDWDPYHNSLKAWVKLYLARVAAADPPPHACGRWQVRW